MIHSRDAWDDTFRVLDDEGVPARTIFHCFTGGPDEARARARPRLPTSRSAASCRSRPPTTCAAAAAVTPPERVLVETDRPYLAPVPHRGRENEPAYVALVGEGVAAATGRPVDEVAHSTAALTRSLFGLETAT